MKGSISRRCYCRDPESGKEYGAACPALTSPKHGVWEYRDRITTSAGVKPLRRAGFPTKKAATAYRDRVAELAALAKGDKQALARIGDLVLSIKRGAELPPVEDVRRRLGLGSALDSSMTFAEWAESWFAAKKRARKESTLRLYRQHLDHYLIPQLGAFPIDRLAPLHISDMFDLIEEWNAEIVAARAEGRRPVLEHDMRKRAKLVGVATQHRILETLKNCLNAAMHARPVRLIDYNPTDSVELEPERREPIQVWDPEQVGTFLESTVDDPLHLLYRLVLLYGPRRGEVVGARWTGHDSDTRALRVLRPLLQLGGRLVESTPKTQAGERVLFLDEDTNEGLRRLHTVQAKNRLAWGEAYQDNDLIFCREDGSPYYPDWVSRHFKDLARAAGLPPIRLHAGRHTAASLRLEAGVDVKVVSEQLGHSTSTITRDLYQHVRRAVLDQATDAVIRLLPDRTPKPRKQAE